MNYNNLANSPARQLREIQSVGGNILSTKSMA